ncbi:MAG: hypothetical protein IPJ76_00055 [Flavobacteriales bacterium]|nr:MAG: hypothetical protein IPJ76_00055 [Flavobacteriales bacterium]
MARMRVLLTVTTYPLPSRSYDELVCTAGVCEDGTWVRIYPVPLSFLMQMKRSGRMPVRKYTWIEADLERRKDDFRPESHSPVNRDFNAIAVGEHIGTERAWAERKHFCLRKVYTSMAQLIAASQEPTNVSLATFKPARFISFDVEKDERDWKPVWKDLRQQLDLFAEGAQEEPKEMIPKLPYKFYYRFVDSDGKESRMMIEDWEIGQLFWNCLRDAEGNEEVAVAKVRAKYEGAFLKEHDIHLFLGTTQKFHAMRAANPFVIIGVFYPKRLDQLGLFE